MKESNNDFRIISLIGNSIVQTQLFEMLDTQDLVNLLCLNKNIKSELLTTPILNRLYFLAFLKHTDAQSFYYCDSPQFKRFEQQKLNNLLEKAQNISLGKINNMKTIKNQMFENLRKICCQQKSLQIVDTIFRSMITPSLPKLNLRKETVGDYCDSPMQIFMAQLNWRINYQKVDQQPYRSFKVELLNIHENILEDLKENNSLLIKIRFQPELINKYPKTNSAYLNIILSFLKLIDQHLVSIKKVIQLHQQLPTFEFVSQFLKRYNAYRNMVLLFENNLGFVFELFTKSFNYLHPELQIYPECSIWRTLMKKWVKIMKPFETKLAEGFIELLTQERQDNLKKIVKKQNNLNQFSSRINFNYLMKNKISNKTVSQEFDIIIKDDPFVLGSILNQYFKYLTDVSINQYSVHWCSSSQQKLNSIYYANEWRIIESSNELYCNWSEIFEDNIILKKALEFDIKFLKNIVKPVTRNLIIQKANKIIKAKFKLQTKLISGGFQFVDNRIRSLNQKRNIPLQLEDQYKQFFDFDQTISLSKIQNIIKSMSNNFDINMETKQTLIQAEE